jgi:hypothetical protein
MNRQPNRRGLAYVSKNTPPPQKKYAALPDKRENASKTLGVKSAKAVKAEQIIPLDDEELGEF